MYIFLNQKQKIQKHSQENPSAPKYSKQNPCCHTMSHCDCFFIFACFQLALLLVWAAEKPPKFEDPLLKGGSGKSELIGCTKVADRLLETIGWENE
jgi:hypothetical protein